MPIDITVIIPSYKPQEYLKECIQSIAQQTLDKSQFELIIVLNGCDHPYHDRINTILQQYPQLQAHVLQTEAPGVSNARNLGMEHAKGENICFIDDDDWISHNYLEYLLKAKTSDSCITVSNVQDYDEKNDLFHDDYITKAYNKFAHEGTAPLIKGRAFLSSACCKMIPSAIIGSKQFDTSFTTGEDSLFMAAISNHITSIKLAKDNAIYYRRERSGSASRSNQSIKTCFRELMKAWKAYTKIYLSDISHYNFIFFATRLAAVFITQIQSLHHKS